MMFVTTLFVLLAVEPPKTGGVGTIVPNRGAGRLTCATAFREENRTATENWIMGYWTAWDMAQVRVAKPVAAGSDLNGIAAEVEKVCRDAPSTQLLGATIEARNMVKARENGPPR